MQRDRVSAARRLPRLGFGGASIGNLYRPITESQAHEAIMGALEAGITYFDTAPFYGFGLSERRLGATLAQTATGRAALISTKVGRLLEPVAANTAVERHGFVGADAFDIRFDYGYDGVLRSFEQSCLRLKRDRIDILLAHDLGRQIHGEAHDAYFRQFLDGGYRAMRELRDQRSVGAIGLGVNEWEICVETLQHVDLDVFLLAGRYTLLDHSALAEFLPLCTERDIPVILGGPYNSGVLASGSKSPGLFNYAQASEATLAQVRVIEALCRDFDVALPAAALQFPLAHPQIISVVPGLADRAEVQAARDLLATPIPNDFWRALRDQGLLPAAAPLPGGAPREA
jgi:D-threo-aldose 1-dehydrogenase